MDTNAAHVQRCRAICDTLEIPWCHGSSFAARIYDLFPTGVGATETEANVRQRAYLLYAAFLGRIPRESEVLNFHLRLEDSDPEVVAAFLTQRLENDRGELAASGSLLCPPANTLIIDVTHTLNCPHTSGIQRVVRSLSYCLCSQNDAPVLVRYCKQTHRYVALNHNELMRLISPQARTRWRRLPARLWDKVLGLARARYGQLTGHHQGVGIFFWKHSLLLPEVITDSGRIAALTVVLMAAFVRSTMLLYDLIPVRHSEYFPDGLLSGYIRYLTLLRHVDAISCISKAVQDDLNSLLPLVARTKPPPRLRVHYLGADFVATNKNVVTVPSIQKPLVVCVGTIEPRKNQLRIADAMIRAQSRGCQFTGLFVGNAGWLNGEFRSYLARHSARGHQLLLLEHASDAELEGIYRASAFTIYSSLAEGFGLPIIESVMRGKACITSDRGSMKEVADQVGGCFLVNPEDSHAMSWAIQTLLEDPVLLGRYETEAANASWPTWRNYAEDLRHFSDAAFTPQHHIEAGSHLCLRSSLQAPQPTASHA